VKTENSPEYQEGLLDRIVGDYYAPFLLKPVVKILVFLSFLALLVVGIASIPRIELGLDQKIALPQDSYLIPYFEDQVEQLKVGVPVYFVISDLNVTLFENQKKVSSIFNPSPFPSRISNLPAL